MNELLMHVLPQKQCGALSLDDARKVIVEHPGTHVFVLGADLLPLVSHFPEKEFVFLIETQEDLLAVLQAPTCHYHIRMPGSEEADFFHVVGKEHPTDMPLVLGIDTERVQKVTAALARAYFIVQEKKRYPELLKNIIGAAPAIMRAALFDTFDPVLQGIPAIVCGAGPTLTHSFERLRSLQGRACIIAGGSAIPLLCHNGIVPDLAVALDPNVCEYDRLKTVKQNGIPLLFSGRVHHKVHELSFDPLYVALQTGGVVEERVIESLELTYNDTIDPDAATVTSLALDAAHRLGAASISIVGVDLAFENEKRYPTGTHFQTEPESFMEMIEVEGEKTTPLWAKERTALERQIAKYTNVVQVNPVLPLRTCRHTAKLDVQGGSLGKRFRQEIEKKRHAKQDAVRAVFENYEKSLMRCAALYKEQKLKPCLKDVIEHDLSLERAYEDLLLHHDNRKEYLTAYLDVFKKMKSW